MGHSDPANFFTEEPRISSKDNLSCDSIFCHQRFLKSEETILNLSRLLDHQLKIVDEMRLEARELGGRYEELRQKMDDKYEEFEARIFNKQTENKAASSYPPPGYRRNSDDNIHIEKGVWIARSKYNEACNSNSPSLFVKLLCDMVFSPEELKNSTVTGRTSNTRKPGSLPRAPKKLDPTRVLAIKDITRYWLETLNMSDETVDNKVEKVKSCKSAKIAELQRPPCAKGKKRRLSQGEGQGADAFEAFPDNDLVLNPTLDNSNLLSSESDSGAEGDELASENANIRRILEYVEESE